MRVLAAICLLTVTAALTGCADAGHANPHRDPSRASTPGEPAAANSGSRIGWLMTRRALAEVTVNAAVRHRFLDTSVDELLAPGQPALIDVYARTVVAFSSVGVLEDAVRSHDLPAHAYAVLYDPEAWAFTPSYQQRHPVASAARAAAVAHADGLRLIVAPALNLVTVLAPSGGESRPRRFLTRGLAGQMARRADVVELQAQSLERTPAAYRAFVRAAAAQARSANPTVSLIAGLSTNPPGAPVTLSLLRRDIRETSSVVGAYWLNVPAPGARCPTCNASRPAIAIALTSRP